MTSTSTANGTDALGAYASLSLTVGDAGVLAVRYDLAQHRTFNSGMSFAQFPGMTTESHGSDTGRHINGERG